MEALSDVEILDKIGQQIWDGVGQPAMEALLMDNVGDDDIHDALGAIPTPKHIVRLARKKLSTFRREFAATADYNFKAGSPTSVDVELKVIRPLKILFLGAVVWQDTTRGGQFDSAILFKLSTIMIDGVQQTTSAPSFNLYPWQNGEEVSGQRPPIDLDTVNTTVPLTATLEYIGPALAGTDELNVELIFGGIAARKR